MIPALAAHGLGQVAKAANNAPQVRKVSLGTSARGGLGHAASGLPTLCSLPTVRYIQAEGAVLRPVGLQLQLGDAVSIAFEPLKLHLMHKLLLHLTQVVQLE